MITKEQLAVSGVILMWGVILVKIAWMTVGRRRRAMCEEMGKMPEYKCHKTVRAFKILDIYLAEEAVNGKPLPPRILEGDANKVTVNQEYMEKHKPHVGGYYVRYKDGYESFSPAEAFESGYTLID